MVRTNSEVLRGDAPRHRTPFLNHDWVWRFGGMAGKLPAFRGMAQSPLELALGPESAGPQSHASHLIWVVAGARSWLSEMRSWLSEMRSWLSEMRSWLPEISGSGYLKLRVAAT